MEIKIKLSTTIFNFQLKFNLFVSPKYSFNVLKDLHKSG